MEIFQIKINKNLKNSVVDLSGKVIYSYPAKGGFWLNIQDKTGNIFVFSKENYKQNELLKIKGTVKSDNKGKAYIYSDSIHKVFQPRESPILAKKSTIFAPEKKGKTKKLIKINKKILIVLVIILIIGSSLYFYNRFKRSELESFLDSVNKDFKATLNSCTKKTNTEKRDKCLYRLAPYTAKTNLSLALSICESISIGSEVDRCLNFLSMYLVKNDTNLSISICDKIGNTSSRNNCILGLVPDLVQQDMTRTLGFCAQFNNELKRDCYSGSASYISKKDISSAIIICKKIDDNSMVARCISSLSLSMAEKDINQSLDICNSIEDISLKNNCIISLIPNLWQEDKSRVLELCNQFDDDLKGICVDSIRSIPNI